MLIETFVLIGLSAGSVSFWYYAKELYLNEKKNLKNFNNEIPPGYSEFNNSNNDNDNDNDNDNPAQTLISPPPLYDT